MLVLTIGGYFTYLNTPWAASWARDYTVNVASVLSELHEGYPTLDLALSDEFIYQNVQGFDIDLDEEYYLAAYLDPEEYMAVLTLDGQIIASNWDSPEGTILETVTFPRANQRDVAFNQNGFHGGLAGIRNGDNELIGWLYFEGNGDDIMFALVQTARTMAIPTVLSGLLAAIASALVGAILAGYFGRRLRALSTASAGFAAGDLEQRVHLKGRDEFAQLGVQFNRMADQIQTQMGELHDLATVEERNRLARELHDGVKQQLFSLNLTIGAIKSIMRTNPDVAEERLTQVVAQSQSIHEEIDAIIKQLRPVALQEHGLAKALDTLTQSWGATHAVAMDYSVEAAREVPRRVEEVLYRVAQEALQNIGKHANAQHVGVTLLYTDSEIQLTIVDDGDGFDAAAARNGLGLRSMQERLDEVAGRLDVASEVTKGSRIRAYVPIGVEIG